MAGNVELFDALAAVMSYPRGAYHDAVTRASELAAGSEAEIPLVVFRDAIAEMPVDELEELYTRTFDLDPVAALDLGWHLWGDAYERGRFLANLREWLAEAGISENGELPDHLSHVLPLLARLDAKRAAELMRYVRPAIAKIRKSFDGTVSVFVQPVLAVGAALEAAFPGGATTDDGSAMSIAGFEATPYEVS